MANDNVKHQATRLQVVSVVIFYMVAALIMVVVNKWVLLTSTLPLTFLFAQLVIAVLLIHLTSFVGFFTLPRPDPKLMKDILAIVVVNVTGLVFNTLCLMVVDASYFQIARGLVLPLTVFLASLLLRQRPPTSTIVCCSLVTIGFLYGITPKAASPTNDRGNTQLGIVYGVVSAVMIAVHAILVKWSLRKVDVKDMDATYVINLAYLTNLMSAVLLFPVLILLGEVWEWKALLTNETGTLKTFLVGSAVTGTFGFFICMAGLLSITVTSPVSHMFSSAVRSVLQTFLGIAVFGDVLTVPRAVSIAFIIAGSAMYAYFRAQAPPLGSAPAASAQKHAEEGRKEDSEESVPMLEKKRAAEEQEAELEGDLGGYREEDDDEVRGGRKG
ncbi:hypothetical protein BDY24DRAFT_392988 [Mrakia frigida]|uniref:uncharacterized protein n=1 Tax=Mrakia frigida TaxID=29902 RepID=UPI003FCC2110